MIVYTRVVTFSSSAVQVANDSSVKPAPQDSSYPMCHEVRVEPLAANSHICWVGNASVTNDGSGTGVITELAKPGQVSQQSPAAFHLKSPYDTNFIDLTQLYFHGTSGEKVTVSWFVV